MDGQERQHAGWTVREYDAGASGAAVLLLPGGMCTTGFYDDQRHSRSCARRPCVSWLPPFPVTVAPPR